MLVPRPRILCADDDEDTRFMLSNLLSQAGYDAVTARSIAEATTLATSESFDLYLLDNKFVDGMGTDLCRWLRAFNPQAPVLFFSGVAEESERQLAMDVGAREYLVKPDDLDRLPDTIARLINDANN